ncbi:MAG TPA: T9SS type A sorting domain-containing protein, partial [Bacteroidia bacterium]|nr:T9SS type A sorting domain-containing protein [Bacteroidia bacterium]
YLFPPDTCRSKIYYNGPFKIHFRDEMEIIPDEITTYVFPNPSNGLFELIVLGNLFGNIKVRIINTLGQTVLQKSIEKVNGRQSYPLDAQSLSRGIYFIEILGSDNEKASSKFMIYK